MENKDEKDEEDRQLIALLLRRQPGRQLGTALHTAIMRLVTSVAIEVVALRCVRDRTEILLRRCEQDAPSYPGQWHLPGTMMRIGEREDDALRRLEAQESIGRVIRFRLVSPAFWMEERGWVCSLILLVELDGQSSLGAQNQWFAVDALPEPLVPEHRDVFIPMAHDAFMSAAYGI
ncbi:MAG: hypothetical protein Q7R83_02325 [bacterium]|nr:hypothetical protein [bacterium]